MSSILKISSNNISAYWFLLLFLFFNCDCNGQNTNESKGLIKAKSTHGVIAVSDGSSGEYYFYDDAGRIVKKIRHDQFESKHPICKLDALKKKLPDSLRGYHVLPLEKDKNSESGTKRLNTSIVNDLNSLKKFGISVNHPEKASVIMGCPSDLWPIISMPGCKYLTTIETVNVLDYSAEETEGRGNALLDCSYLTVYNYLGNIFKEVLVPDKIVTSATISDDGNFLMCSYSYTYLWDEGVDVIPDGILIADLSTGKLDYLSTTETKNSLSPGSILFADNYFQVTIGNPWSGDSCVRMYINPYNRKYYIKLYEEDRQKRRRPILQAQSFIQFEGIIESPEQFNSFSY